MKKTLLISLLLLTGCTRKPVTAKTPKLQKGACMVDGVNAKNEPTLLHCRDINGKEWVFHR